jgi:hypothetical protein
MEGSVRMPRNRVFALLFLIVAIIGLSACSYTATSSAMCSFVVGNGQNGEDANLHKVVLPGENVSYDSNNEEVSYVPCNGRNYITNDGSVKNANGDAVGDRFEPTVAYTKNGLPIEVWSTAYWTLNQNPDAMAAFYTLCHKYSCASTDDQGGSANFSTKGWNGMLAENFGPALDAIIREESYKLDDTIADHNPELYRLLGETVSNRFAEFIRKTTGFEGDLFCGSGNSQWDDPTKPGEGAFTCTNVRITIDEVNKGVLASNDNGAGAQAVNEQRLAAASALYGPELAPQVLAAQDILAQCTRLDHAVCNVTLPGGTPAPVAVPAP